MFEILISPKAAGPVDVVEVFIRFEAPGTYLVKRILETAANAVEDTGRQEYRVNIPFHEKFTNVPGGTMYSFRIDRIN